ncbi:hypothetical protein O181_133895 [Austropuccinia psidii MF-1]|uniref:Uncharacterized protein n=1 Tax=Austropuccinia psidii MF-1 TaxID=1389203 RepID=A0A9Q3L5L2_9BASI|nr:hypothetical protein [Austropuccinia psidii MF-1]
MRPKRAKGAVQQSPKPQVGPPEPVLAPNTNQPKMAKKTNLGPKLAINWSMASGNHQRPPAHLKNKDSPPVKGKTSFSSMHSILKDQEWCIYGIIYHYAPFLLSNPMVTPSGPNYVIPNQVPNPSPILKEEFSAIQSGNSLAATRRSFEDPNYLALQESGFQFSSGPF